MRQAWPRELDADMLIFTREEYFVASAEQVNAGVMV
jgi:hypothetical protein